MLSKIKKSNDEGFTIIEVMIVLAVAALILLIVLLAVPALQRSSRNTTIKNDASSVAGGITTFESDNNGIEPTSVASAAGVVTIKAATGTAETINVNGSTTVQNVTPSSGTVGSTVTSSVLPPSTIDVVFGYPCAPSGTSLATEDVAANASPRSIALYYVTETGNSSGNILECVSS